MIIDRTLIEKDTNVKIPIELVSCLQWLRAAVLAVEDPVSVHYFYKSESGYKGISIHSIERIARNVVPDLDLILVNEKLVFLGKWNDGVL